MTYAHPHRRVQQIPADGLSDTSDLLSRLFADAARDGCEVVLPAGAVYLAQNLILPAGLRLRGPATLRLRPEATRPLIVVAGSGVSIRDLTLDGNKRQQFGARTDGWAEHDGQHGHAYRPLIFCDGFDALTLERCTLRNAWFSAVATAGGRGHFIAHNFGIGNVGKTFLLYVNPARPSEVPTNHLLLHNDIRDGVNDVDASGGWGGAICVSQSDGCVAAYNRIDNTDRGSLKFENARSATIEGNHVSNTLWSPIAVQTFGARLRIIGNHCEGAGESGIYVYGSTGFVDDILIDGNQIYDCGRAGSSNPHGITLAGVRGGIVSNNLIRNALGCGIYVTGEPSYWCDGVSVYGGQISECRGLAAIRVRADRARNVTVHDVMMFHNVRDFWIAEPASEWPRDNIQYNGI